MKYFFGEKKSFLKLVYRFVSIVGPRTVQLGKDYTVFVTSVDYGGDEKLELNLVGQKLGEEIETKIFDLGHFNENVTLNVSF